ncbi:MAG TPA: flagellar biosynthesis protein FlhA [Pyrinomonadaceae bacterium]|jgi:type III secretion protein V
MERLKNIWLEVRRGGIVTLLARYGDILLPVALMLVIATLIVPVPPFLISMLVVINLAVSFIILLTSLNISSPVQLTSYPTVLLLTTLFRLCLSVSVARSILSAGEAGDVIEMLGKVPGGGDIIVGGVVFLMILVVQFIVVAKGSERIAEVAARFTLDALPGKQMAIDADMRSGLITQDEARRSRSALQQESQLYGAMDGSMKFVKGDSVATIVIAMINVAAGFAVGVLRRGMSPGEAAQVYTVLTIGDGLSAVISSMLITVSAGIVVTRVASEESRTTVGADITRQLLGNPKPLALASGLLTVLALALTFSGTWAALPLFAFGAVTGLIAYSLQRAAQASAREEAERLAMAGESAGQDELVPSYAVPLSVVVSPQLTHLIDSETESGARFRADLPRLRSSIYYDLGVMLPSVFVAGDAPLKPEQYFIAIKEVPVARGTLKPGCVYVNDSAENIRDFGLDGEDMPNPADLSPGAWIPSRQRESAERAGLQVWEPAQVILLHLANVLKRHAHEFVGIQEAHAYLDFAAQGMPKLVEEVVPKVVSVQQFREVLQKLVQEGISIRDIKSILDAMSERGRIEKDPVMLTEHIRCALRRYICYRHTGGRDTLYYYTLDAEIEDIIGDNIRRTTTDTSLKLNHVLSKSILDALRREIAVLPPTAQKPVLVTEMKLRRFVRGLVELEFPGLTVLSFQELTPDINLIALKRISMRPGQTVVFADPAAVVEGASPIPKALT